MQKNVKLRKVKVKRYSQSPDVFWQWLGKVGQSPACTVNGESLAVALLRTEGQLYAVLLVECVAIVDAQEDEAEEGECEEVHGGDR